MGRLSAVEIAALLDRPAPTAEQIRVIESPQDPTVVVAGAGSGKTETMAARVVWLIAGGDVAPDEVLGLTFTRKAAGELAERIRGRLRALRRSGAWTPVVSDDDDIPRNPHHPSGPNNHSNNHGDPDDTDPTEVVVSTYHAYAGRLVREHGLRLGLEPTARLLTEASCWQLATGVVERWAGPMDAVDAAASTVTAAVLALSGEAAEHLVDLDELDDYLARRIEIVAALPYNDRGGDRQYADVGRLLARLSARRQILPLVRAYQQAKRERDSLDFGDQLAYAAQLAQTVPQLRSAERARFRTVLLDEFQDTSHAQLVMLQHVFGDGHPVTAVGDPHQSIYGWRGASADTLAAFGQSFRTASGQPAQVHQLSTSWRNDRRILAAANATAAPLGQHTGVPVRPAQPRPDAGGGQVQIMNLPTAEAEAEAVVQWLADHWLTADGKPPQGRTAAILCRRRAQFTDLEPALLRRGLPYQIVGLGGLLATPEISDVLAGLHVVHDPTRADLLMRLLTGPSCRLGAHDLTVLGAWSRHLHRLRTDGHAAPDPTDAGSLIEALDELPPLDWADREDRQLTAPARARLARLADTIRDLRGRTALPLPELVAEVERALLLDIEVASRPGVRPAQARAQLDALAQVAANFAASADYPTLGAFLSWLAAAQTHERGLEPGQVDVVDGVIQVLTVHAAKGLEWDLVAVPGLVEGAFPQHRNPVKMRTDGLGWQPPTVTDRGWLAELGTIPHALRGDRAALPDIRWTAAHQQQFLSELADFERAAGEHQLAEERRLAYVAWTRARSRLLLTGHVWGTTKTARLISRFVLELAPQLFADPGSDPGADPDPGAGLGTTPGAAPGADPRAEIAVEYGAITAMPDEGEQRPGADQPITTPWPVDPLGARRPQVEAAAALVRQAQASEAPVVPAHRLAEVVNVLLAERDRGRAAAPVAALPTHISASKLVQLAADPQKLALDLRRPMPHQPIVAARRGTAFHAWVERHLGATSLVELLELPGAADEDPAADSEFERLVDNFLASEWAGRPVVAVEVPLETPIDGTVIRGRVDAVFARPDGGVDIVDWKTGAVPPPGPARFRDLQLAAYRLAWHRLHEVPLAKIGAAFCYVAHGHPG
jgi:DNA helicase II / ATP-dependent DNA helicase PcrA